MGKKPTKRVYELLERAYEVEKLAIEAYTHFINTLVEADIATPEIVEILEKMILDSLLHKNLVKALIKSLEI